jgi:hypothetical protein
MPDVLDQLRESGQRLVDAASLRPTGLDAVMARGRATRRRRTATVALCSLLAIALAVGAIAASASGHHSAPLLHTTAPATNTRPQPKPKPGPTDQQLAASLGVGVPNGWVPVDFGDARLWVPPTSSVFAEPARCSIAGAKVPSTGTFVVLDQLDNRCEPDLTPHSWISLDALPSSAALPSRSALVVHGFDVYLEFGSPLVAGYDVPQLGVRVRYHRADAAIVSRIVSTLGPSARAIAGRSDLAVDTSSWRTVRWGDVEWRQPPEWRVRDLAGTVGACGPSPPLVDEVTVGEPIPSRAACPAVAPDPIATAPTDRVAAVACSSCTSEPSANALTRVVGSTMMTISLGVDGRIGGAVLRSVREVPSSALHVDGCPSTVPRDRTSGDRFATLVPGHPSAVAICSYHGAGVDGAAQDSLAAFAPGDAAHWQAMLNALPPVTKAVCNGQNDNGPHVALHFTYADSGPTDVTIGSPCGWATNGHSLSWVTGSHVFAELSALVGVDCSFPSPAC